MTTDMNGREIKVDDIYCSPSDCEGLQFVGIVTEVADDTVTSVQITHSGYSTSLCTKSYHDPKRIKVLASIADTRVSEEVTA